MELSLSGWQSFLPHVLLKIEIEKRIVTNYLLAFSPCEDVGVQPQYVSYLVRITC